MLTVRVRNTFPYVVMHVYACVFARVHVPYGFLRVNKTILLLYPNTTLSITYNSRKKNDKITSVIERGHRDAAITWCNSTFGKTHGTYEFLMIRILQHHNVGEFQRTPIVRYKNPPIWLPVEQQTQQSQRCNNTNPRRCVFPPDSAIPMTFQLLLGAIVQQHGEKIHLRTTIFNWNLGWRYRLGCWSMVRYQMMIAFIIVVLHGDANLGGWNITYKYITKIRWKEIFKM